MNRSRFLRSTLAIAALSLAGCIVAPPGRPRYVEPVMVAPPPAALLDGIWIGGISALLLYLGIGSSMAATGIGTDAPGAKTLNSHARHAQYW